MKRIFSRAFFGSMLAVALSSLLFSCASTFSISDCGPVAVISVIGNKSVPWYDSSDEDTDDANSVLSTSVNRLVGRGNIEFSSCENRIDYADEAIRFGLQDIAGVEVIDKEKVVNSQQYEDMHASFYNLLVSTVSADGYKDLTTIGSKNSRLLMREIGAKSLMLFEFDFRKELVKGTKWNGEVGGYIMMKVEVKDERGNAVVEKNYEIRSSSTIPIKNLRYDKDELVNLLEPTIDAAVARFIVDYMN